MDEIERLREVTVPVGGPRLKESGRAALHAHIAEDSAGSDRPSVAAGSRRVRDGRRFRTMVVAVAAASVVALAVVAAFPLSLAGPAFAATPQLLVPASDTGVSATTVLKHASAATARQSPVGTARYDYLRTASWNLQTAVSEQEVVSEVVPMLRETWIAPDGSGLAREARGEPVDAPAPGAKEDRVSVNEMPGDGSNTQVFEPGELAYSRTSDLPRDPDALRDVLLARGGDVPDHVQIFVALTELSANHRLEPDLLGAFYEMLAAEPEIRSYGDVVDRAGRTGEALGFDSNYGGLPARYLLVIDASTGTLLGTEEILTRDAGELNVRVPAVIGYTAYLAGGSVASLDQRGPVMP